MRQILVRPRIYAAVAIDADLGRRAGKRFQPDGAILGEIGDKFFSQADCGVVVGVVVPEFSGSGGGGDSSNDTVLDGVTRLEACQGKAHLANVAVRGSFADDGRRNVD